MSLDVVVDLKCEHVSRVIHALVWCLRLYEWCLRMLAQFGRSRKVHITLTLS